MLVLLPLHRADGFGGEVVGDAADAGDLVGDAVETLDRKSVV